MFYEKLNIECNKRVKQLIMLVKDDITKIQLPFNLQSSLVVADRANTLIPSIDKLRKEIYKHLVQPYLLKKL